MRGVSETGSTTRGLKGRIMIRSSQLALGMLRGIVQNSVVSDHGV